jgi:hypothetical protein
MVVLRGKGKSGKDVALHERFLTPFHKIIVGAVAGKKS